MPKISVIIPVYNAEKYLRECLDSVVHQTLRDIEIICVDDGSTDKSLTILQEYARKDSRVIVLTQQNLHAGVARNTGLAKATGEYVYFLDSDDWLTEDSLQNMCRLIEEKKVPFLKFCAYLWNEKTKQIDTQDPYTAYSHIKAPYRDNYIHLNPVEMRRLIKLPDSPWSGVYNLRFLKSNHIYFDDFMCSNDVGFFFRCIAALGENGRTYFSSKEFLYHRRGVKRSLITRRAEHFENVTALVDVVGAACSHLPWYCRSSIRHRLINNCLNWWFVCCEYPSNTWQTHDKLFRLMRQYLRRIRRVPLQGAAQRRRTCAKRKLLWEKIQRLFSVRTRAGERILFIAGFRIKL